MEYVLKERIGKPELFIGRKEELGYFLNWINEIKEEKSQSSAIMARRKMGKTAILERLFNITFYKNDGVIPFYYEIKEREVSMADFCVDFFLTFVYQYIAFKTRKITYLAQEKRTNLKEAKVAALKEGLNHLTGIIENVKYAFENGHTDMLWETAREAPKTVALGQKEFIVQMIDEFKFIDEKIFRDKELKLRVKDMAGGYLSTAESKIAPLLVSGSWVGWLMNLLMKMLPSRFRYEFLENMPEDEAIEMIFKYAQFFGVPVTEETAYLMAKLSEGSPFYISSIIRSRCRDKNLTTIEGLAKVMEFETLDDRGAIKSTWMEYISGAFPRINDQHAKNIVLYLCRHRDREVTRKELLTELKPGMSDSRLEEKLKALVHADIIKQGQTNYDYRGVQDNVFDKVFRGVYEKEIREFDVKVIGQEYREDFYRLKTQYYSLLGKYNYQKGYYTEYAILDRLRVHAREDNRLLKSITRYLPHDFNFSDYSRVWKYESSPEYSRRFSVDIFARASIPGDYSIIGEVKSRDLKKFSKDETAAFELKFEEIKKLEKVEPAVGFIFSRSGFTKEAEDYCKEKGIACSEDERWLI